MQKMNFKKVQGTKLPLEIDTTSSPGHVYIRQNIKEIETDEGAIMYEYDEMCLTNDEYIEYEAEKSNPMLAILMQKQNELQLIIYQMMVQIGGAK